ncbi:helix-turn-helix domain-containing protein [Streptomyces tsukubensis]|uniref:helix-turn-helix domain-containing protein n=1 Tax=Streptomyces tsukubensis TaxID=83656 RepID=UPI00344C6863
MKGRKSETEAHSQRDLVYEIAQAVHDMRTALGWSQGELAEKAGTKQPNISRLESARSLPTLELLHRLASAMDADLTVTLTPRRQDPLSAATAATGVEVRTS